MAQNPIDEFFSGTTSPAGLSDLMQETLAFTVDADAVPLTDWAPAACLIVDGVLFAYDASDVTSAHDGAFVLVSADGRRYKANAEAARPFAVDDIIETPPGSPVLGQRFLIGPAPTGDFAAHADDIAVYTYNGWQFINAANLIGSSLYCEADDTTYQLTPEGWRAGFGAATVSDGALDTTHLAASVGRLFVVENQTTNAPPGSPGDQVAYVIGPSPTGDWSGKQAQVAVRIDGAWVYHVPAEGWQIWDKAQDLAFIYYGSAWRNAIGAAQTIKGMAAAYQATAATLTVQGLGAGTGSTVQYTYSDGTAPVDQRRVVAAGMTVTLAASAASRKLLFEWDGFDPRALAAVDYTPSIAIYRDSDASAVLWMPISVRLGDPAASDTAGVVGADMPRRGIILSDDAASHTYKLAITTSLAIGATFTLPKNASFSVTEVT